MNCADIKRYLPLYLDSELGPETTFEINSHLEECASCRTTAGLEERLEKRIQQSLLRERSEDQVLWSRSLKYVRRSQTHARRSLWALGVTGMVAAAAVFVLWFSRGMLVYDELDLAEATAAVHTQELLGSGAPLAEPANPEELEAFFRREISPEYCLKIDTLGSMRLRSGSVCRLGSVRAAHVVCADSATTASLFWMPAAGITEFPETITRFLAQGDAFHCHVDPYEFFVQRAGVGIVVGVVESTPEEIERMVADAAATDCMKSL